MKNKSHKLYWEYTVFVDRKPIGTIPLCGLCANSGVIDTTKSAIWSMMQQSVGVVAYCICPNGRVMSKKSRAQHGSAIISTVTPEGPMHPWDEKGHSYYCKQSADLDVASCTCGVTFKPGEPGKVLHDKVRKYRKSCLKNK